MWGPRAGFKQKRKRKGWLHSWAENENERAWWPNMARLGSSPRGSQLGRLARAAAREEGRLRFVQLAGKKGRLGFLGRKCPGFTSASPCADHSRCGDGEAPFDGDGAETAHGLLLPRRQRLPRP